MLYLILTILVLIYGSSFYSKRLENSWGVKIHAKTATDDNYAPSFISYRTLQICQFGITLSLECIISGAVGILYGPLFMIWCIVGTIFFGGVLNYYCGMYALTHKNKTINYAVMDLFGKKVHILTTVILLLFMAAGIATCFIFLRSINFYSKPFFNLVILYPILILFLAIVPQKVFSGIYGNIALFVLFSTSILLFGTIFSGADFHFSANPFNYPQMIKFYPTLFVAISAGAISGIQGLQSSLIAQSLRNEKMARKTIFGAAVFQAIFVVLWGVMFLAWYPSIEDLTIGIQNGPMIYATLQNRAEQVVGGYASSLLYLMVAVICISTCGTFARISYKLGQELNSPYKHAPYYALLFVGLTSCLFYFCRDDMLLVYRLLNLFLATLLFGLLALWLKKNKKVEKFGYYQQAFLYGVLVAHIGRFFGGKSLWMCVIAGVAVTATIIGCSYLRKKHKKSK